MKTNSSECLKSVLNRLKNIDYIKPEDIPNIELYMDQVTTFMDEHLKSTKRYDSDKILTKTMINNYAKNDLLPPPVKKKYSKEHMLLLIFIYYFKNILSITDIQSLLNPLTDKYFNTEDGMNLQDIYNEVFGFEKEHAEYLMKDNVEEYKKSSTAFSDAPEEDQEFLQLFSFICILSFDVYIKKMLIEKLIDQIPKPESKKDVKKDKAK